MLVRDVMRKTVSVQAEESLEVAALRLKQENVGALPVVEADQVAGMQVFDSRSTGMSSVLSFIRSAIAGLIRTALSHA